MVSQKKYCKFIIILFLTMTILGLWASHASAALTVQSYSHKKHWRFYTGGESFIGTPYDSSGVGQSPLNGGWAVMISEHYFVTAWHYRPSTGSENPIRFYHTNDPNGAYEDIEYVEDFANGKGQTIGGDLWLGKLETAPSDAVARYPILSLPSGSDYDNLEIYTYGKDLVTKGDTTSQRLGRNNITPGSVTGPTDGSMRFDFNTPGLGDDESLVQSGDSGGPSFALVNDQFALVGLHWAKTSTSSIDTFVPRWITELNDAMAVAGEQVTTVPEPSALGLIIISITSLSLKRRRKSRCPSIGFES